MYPDIIVPLDGSALGEYALPRALAIARRTCATVHLVHVRLPEPVHLVAATEEKASPPDHHRIAQYLEDMAALLAERWEVQIKTAVIEGPVAEALQQYALQINADLIIMTTHGRGPLTRAWLGSVADELVHRMAIPMILVRPRNEALDLLEAVSSEVPHEILIPLDGSPLAEQVLFPALALGNLLEATYTLLQVVEPPFIAGERVVDIHSEETLLSHRERVARDYLEQIAAPLREQGLQVTAQVLIADPPEAIVAYARRHAVDLIAMATHGHTGLLRLVLGSVADQVMRDTPVPVLLFRPVEDMEFPEETHSHSPGRALVEIG